MGTKVAEEGIEQVEAALVDATSKINVAEQELCKLWNPVLALAYKADSNFNDAHVSGRCVKSIRVSLGSLGPSCILAANSNWLKVGFLKAKRTLWGKEKIVSVV